MGLCIKCRKFYAPTIMFELRDGDQQCVFCKVDKNFVTVKEDSGKEIEYTRERAANEYKEFLTQLKNKPSIEKLTKDVGDQFDGILKE